jgi:hypothetical protein
MRAKLFRFALNNGHRSTRWPSRKYALVTRYRRPNPTPETRRYRRAAIFAALEKAGVEFQDDGKRLRVSIRVRKVAK